MNEAVEFYSGAKARKRKDCEFDWSWFYSHSTIKNRMIKHLRIILWPIIQKFRKRSGCEKLPFSTEWLSFYAAPLWKARQACEDELSKQLFDQALILKSCGYEKFFFPRYSHTDILSILEENRFSAGSLPEEFLGMPLTEFTLKLNGKNEEFKVVTTPQMLDCVNKFRQYLILRDCLNFQPAPGDVVFDCGSCIGDLSVIFAAFVGQKGSVHLFDPVPLHGKFCNYQARLNPLFLPNILVNDLAVGAKTAKHSGKVKDQQTISPGGCCVDEFAVTSLDDYVLEKGLKKVDFIKMDIEGAEIDALKGAAITIGKFKPRLAISAYHKPEDLWEIPKLIKELNSEYKIYFDHHTPIGWESVYYAI